MPRRRSPRAYFLAAALLALVAGSLRRRPPIAQRYDQRSLRERHGRFRESRAADKWPAKTMRRASLQARLGSARSRRSTYGAFRRRVELPARIALFVAANPWPTPDQSLLGLSRPA